MAGEPFPLPGRESSYHPSNTSVRFPQQRLLFTDSFIFLRERWIVHSLSVSHLLSLAFFSPSEPPCSFFGVGRGVFSIRFHSILSETEHMLESGSPWCACRLEGVVCARRVLWQRTECVASACERCVSLHLRLVSAPDRDK